MIEVRKLTKVYGELRAVNEISFKVESGQILGLLGPNGAGKTTTLRMLTGFIEPTDGEILIDGKDLNQSPIEAKSSMSYLGEVPPLYTEMKVREYLKFICDLRAIEAAEQSQEIERVLSILELNDVAHTTIETLSKGYKQRVGIAQALVGSPSLIVLDEPTVGLDPLQMLHMREILLKLKKHHTLIFSTHLLSEVQAICDRVVIMQAGQVRADLTRDQWQEKGLEGARHILIQTFETLQKESLSVFEDERVHSAQIVQAHVVEVIFAGSSQHQFEYLRNLIERGVKVTEFKVGEERLESLFVQLTQPAHTAGGDQ